MFESSKFILENVYYIFNENSYDSRLSVINQILFLFANFRSFFFQILIKYVKYLHEQLKNKNCFDVIIKLIRYTQIFDLNYFNLKRSSNMFNNLLEVHNK